MAKITLGGKRLGSGQKMEVNIPEFNRSSHDQGFVFTTDQAFGTLVPALCNIGTRGDVFYLDDITSIVRTLPTNGPVFGSVKQQIDVFCAPIRLYIGALHNNATGIGLKMEQVKMPIERHITTLYQSDLELKNPNLNSVAPDSLGAYLGSKGSWAGAGYTNQEYYTNALFKLMYWDIYKNYYANKQEEEGVVIGGPAGNIGEIISIKFFETGEILLDQTGNEKYGNINNWNGSTINNQTEIEFITSRKLNENEKNSLWIGVEATGGNPTKEYLLKSQWDVEEKELNNKKWTYTFSNQGKNARPAEIKGKGYAGSDILTWEKPKKELDLIRFPLSNIDKMREAILAAPLGTPLTINEVGGQNGMLPYNIETQHIKDSDNNTREARSKTMCGLGVKCHLSDMFNNWIQTDWLDGENGINDLTSIDTTDGKFTINEFILDYKLFKMMNRIAISDGSYDAWQTAVYGQEGRVITESPVYCGGYSSEIAFDEVISQSATQDEPLGSLAGRGSQQNGTREGGKNIKIVCDEAMLIMVISSFTPRTTYSQNEEWWTELKTMNDLHKPDLDGIAFQNLMEGKIAAFTKTITERGNITNYAVGKQTAWVEYTTAVNESFGDFAAGMPLEHLVLNRSYQAVGYGENNIMNATTYIDPTEFNVIFADQELTAKPFWVQIGFNLTSRRKMSAVQIPNL